MQALRYLVFGSHGDGPDPWGEWLWQLVAELERRDGRGYVVLPGTLPPDPASPYRRSLVRGFPCIDLPRAEPTASEGYEAGLRAFLADETARAGPFTAAVIHGRSGHPVSLPVVLRRAGVPVLDFVAGIRALDRGGDALPQGSAARRALDASDLLALPCRPQQDLLAELGIPPSRCCVPPLRLDTLDGIPRIRRRGAVAAPVRLGCAGDLSPAAGLDDLLNALALLPAAGFELAVWGPLGPGDDEAVHGLRDRLDGTAAVHHRGPWTLEELPGLVDEIDVVVVPGPLGEPTATLAETAARRGAFVVCSDLAPSARVVEPGVNGHCFRPGDARDLARAIADTAGLAAAGPAPALAPAGSGAVPGAGEILCRLPLPDGAPRAVSHWSRDLERRILVAGRGPRTPGYLLYPMRWTGEAWAPLAAARQLHDRDLLLPHLARLLAG